MGMRVDGPEAEVACQQQYVCLKGAREAITAIDPFDISPRLATIEQGGLKLFVRASVETQERDDERKKRCR